MLFQIAVRNILRNRRRSLMTILAIAVGAVAIGLFGAFVGFIKAGLETNAVEKVGHLTVFRHGYFDYGAGNPAAYGIKNYREVIELIQKDKELAPLLNVVTPTVALTGIAGNFDIDASKTFLGTGYVPHDRDTMLKWDEHSVMRRRGATESGLSDDDETRGVVGVGLARVLGLCTLLPGEPCAKRPAGEAKPSDEAVADDILALARAEGGAAPGGMAGAPRLDLLTATAQGAPNVMSLFVSKATPQGPRELDENVVVMHFGLAQKLLYGRSEPSAVGIVLQLHHTHDLDVARARLEQLFREHSLDLEARDFIEREPFYKQAVGMFDAIFLFISTIMGVIVLFTVVNTMGMSVVERTTEIGTARAMGQKRTGVRRLFVAEGVVLGAIGATLGVALGALFGILFNKLGATWMPPGQASPVPLEVMTTEVFRLDAGTWVGLVLMATFAAVIPANRAASLKVVDALRHV